MKKRNSRKRAQPRERHHCIHPSRLPSPLQNSVSVHRLDLSLSLLCSSTHYTSRPVSATVPPLQYISIPQALPLSFTPSHLRLRAAKRASSESAADFSAAADNGADDGAGACADAPAFSPPAFAPFSPPCPPPPPPPGAVPSPSPVPPAFSSAAAADASAGSACGRYSDVKGTLYVLQTVRAGVRVGEM